MGIVACFLGGLEKKYWDDGGFLKIYVFGLGLYKGREFRADKIVG